MDDAQIQSELDRLHKAHLAKKGAVDGEESAGRDDRPFVEAEVEASAGGKARA
jgi:hypothetical protein